ncbi:hypothetical protein IAU59_001809 [Kwoniella sp. CBS 9459]
MKLPYNRPWLLEIADHPSCPPTIREGVQNLLTFMWVNRIPPFQRRAPYVGACDVLERILREIELEDEAEMEEKGEETMMLSDIPLAEAQTQTQVEVEVNDSSASSAGSRGRGRGRGLSGAKWNTNSGEKAKPSESSLNSSSGEKEPYPYQLGYAGDGSTPRAAVGASRQSRTSQDQLRIVDFCSGAGGPLGHIERRINQKRRTQALQTVQFILSDLHPPLSTWKRRYGTRSIFDLNAPPSSSSSSSSYKNRLSSSSTTSPSPSLSPLSASASTSSSAAAAATAGLSYIPESIDATSSPPSLSAQRHLRTFFLSFHHFNNELARGVLVDAMRNSEGIAIFELQSCDVGSLVMIAMLGPLSWLVTPFTRPSLATLFFTYIIPLIPLILVIDGWISVYRTRSTPHILHLANLASLSLALEGDDEPHWKWECGSDMHTWPFGRMSWVVGRKSALAEVEGVEGEYGDEEGEGDDLESEYASTYGSGQRQWGSLVDPSVGGEGGDVVVNRDEGAVLQE